jgi:hypothetical protein
MRFQHEAFLADFEGINIGYDDNNENTSANAPLDAYFAGENYNNQFFIIYNPINGHATIILLNNAAILHALTSVN